MSDSSWRIDCIHAWYNTGNFPIRLEVNIIMRVLIFFIFFLSCLAYPLIARGTGPHNEIILNTDIRCSECHQTLFLNEVSPEFNDATDSICLRCHQGERKLFSHPVGVKVRPAFSEEMPLSSDGRLMCITCHTFHSSFYMPILKKKVYLRRIVMEKNFCLRCHRQDLPDKTLVSY